MNKEQRFWSLVLEMKKKHGTAFAARYCALMGVPVHKARWELAKTQGQNVPVI